MKTIRIAFLAILTLPLQFVFSKSPSLSEIKVKAHLSDSTQKSDGPLGEEISQFNGFVAPIDLVLIFDAKGVSKKEAKLSIVGQRTSKANNDVSTSTVKEPLLSQSVDIKIVEGKNTIRVNNFKVHTVAENFLDSPSNKDSTMTSVSFTISITINGEVLSTTSKSFPLTTEH